MIFHIRDIRKKKRFTQIYKALYGNTMLVSFQEHKYGPGKQQKHLFFSSPIYA